MCLGASCIGMYLRTTKRRNKDGSIAIYHQLAENSWDPQRGSSVTKVIYNFGRSDADQTDRLRDLARSILRVVDGRVQTEEQGAASAAEIKVHSTRSFGQVWVLEQLYKELGIDALLLRQQGPRHRTRALFERALFAMIANRSCAPSSKLACWEQWLAEEVYLPSASELELHHLYLAMDFLEDHKPEVEKEIYFAMADLMNADVDLIFYDTTSLHFEVDLEDETTQHKNGRCYPAERKRGYSKNGRGDAPQIVIGLAVTRDGLPVRSWVFAGNTSDVTTIEKVKEDLRGWKLGRCVFVGDSGMNSAENRQRLALGNGKYILASKTRAGDEVTKLVLTRPGRYHKIADNLRVKEVVVGDGARRRRYVLCHNPDEQARQRRHRGKLIAQLEAELETLKQKSGEPHSKRAQQLLTNRRFGAYLRQTKGGLLRINRTAIKTAERYDGKWVVTSNDDTLSAEDMALGYKQLLRVEQCWRQLKSGIRMRPVYHWRPWRIEAHVTISVLALLLERIAELRARDTWRNISRKLKKITVVEYDHDGARIQQTTELSAELQTLLYKLKVDPPPSLLHVARTPADPSDA